MEFHRYRKQKAREQNRNERDFDARSDVNIFFLLFVIEPENLGIYIKIYIFVVVRFDS